MNDPEGSQEFSSHIVSEADQNQSVGQSFVSRRGRLNGITVWVTNKPGQDGSAANGQLVFKLFHSNGEDRPISAMGVAILPDWNNSQIEVLFTPQADPPGQSYYLQIESTGGTVQLHGRNENAYENGMGFVNGSSVDADLAFRLTYDYDTSAILQDLGKWGSQAFLLIPLGLTLYLPGWIILDLTGLKRRFIVGEQASVSVGLSLAILPLLMLWSSIFHIRWSRIGILGVTGFFVGYYLIRFLIVRLRSIKINHEAVDTPGVVNSIKNKSSILIGLALIAIIGGTFFIRLAMVRDLATPAWVDSVHHAMITKLIMQQGYFPASYAPYMEFDVYNYHIGFHSGLAVFTWLSKLEIPDALLIYGQALNALASLAVYFLTTTLTRKPLAGLFAAFITGFLTPMPAYYTSWGRYTQLAGLLIMPTLITLLRSKLHSLNNELTDQRILSSNLILAIIAMSGLFLVHYRVIAFAFLFMIADLIVSILQQNSRMLDILKRWAGIGVICSLGAMLLTFPWFIPTLNNIFLPKLSPPESTTAVLFGDFGWRFLKTAYGKYALVLAGFGLIWAIMKQYRLASVSIIWIFLLLFFSNLDALKLPGGGFITGTSVVIMLFIPISILGGYFLDEVVSTWQALIPRQSHISHYAFWSLITVAVMISAAFGSRQLLPIINPVTILSRQADRTALEWINQKQFQDTTFLINPFSWGFGLYAGNDGGYWISPVTGARSLPPPALYGLGDPSYVEQINLLSQQASNPESTPIKLWEIMHDNGIDYIYLGVRSGPISMADLLKSGLFEQIYDVEGVSILKILPEQ
jgi:hypothetical protein